MSELFEWRPKLAPLPADVYRRLPNRAGRTEAASFLASRDRALRALAAGAPLRLAELCALDVGDVDWRRERLRVQRRGAAAYVWVAREALAHLEAYLDTRPEPKRSVSGEPLFLSRLRRRLSVRQTRDILADAMTQAGVQGTVQRYGDGARPRGQPAIARQLPPDVPG